ncbi:hypothetical protein AGABI2DRAFT_195722 [Agaricus bisporus var. bisporus H97]|uniref:hypothetical protein n=1 Tax=Agaricus bisporus var. bisporus (strain H97 / ATCC MYA-4626 / FGSC 10389) TaxID=936046 RepID=UPI00029F7616|nr:hypothetical protein AGABI2DRAFT_195722 [Agaricus bisporus var. bisporus H97]EKV42375.1 hypothetical protein AGABI2DRAFT_195722 [Agaricus bisporus var. bisporus H97]
MAWWHCTRWREAKFEHGFHCRNGLSGKVCNEPVTEECRCKNPNKNLRDCLEKIGYT